MKSKIIFIDMDNTLNKFWIPYVQSYNKIFNKNTTCDPSIQTSYSLTDCLGLEHGSKEEALLDEATMNDWDFWTKNMPVYEEAIPIVRDLYEKHDVYILSTPYIKYDLCIAAKMQWMEKHFPFFDKTKMIFTWHKELLKGDVLIDDKPSNLESFCGKKITIKYPYNKHCQVDLSANNWNEIKEYFEKEIT